VYSANITARAMIPGSAAPAVVLAGVGQAVVGLLPGWTRGYPCV